MSNSGYINDQISGNSNPVFGFSDINRDAFSLINNKLSSWSFDGSIPSLLLEDSLWNRELKKFNIASGDYVVVVINDENAVTYPVIDITLETGLGFFDYSDNPNGVRTVSITNVSGNGTQITYTANNDYVEKERVTITGMPHPDFDLSNVMVVSATSTSFTVLGTKTGGASFTGFTPTAEVVTSFRSNVYINYLDENYTRQVYQIVTLLNDEGYPYNRVAYIRDVWNERDAGTGGWLLTSSGNAIFNNIAARGEINAQSGNFEGFLTVNNGEMKLGANVLSLKKFPLQSFSVSSNVVTLVTTSTHNFLVGDLINVVNSDTTRLTYVAPTEGEEIPGTVFDIDGLHTVTAKTSNTISFEMVARNTSSIDLRESYVELNEYYDGIHINTNNYWYSNGRFSVGNGTNGMVWDSTANQLSVTGNLTANTLNVGGSNGITYDGTSVNIGSAVNIEADLSVNALLVGSGDYYLRISENVSDINNLRVGTLVNDGLYVDRYNYWYSDGRFSVGGLNGTMSFDPTDAEVELRISDKLSIGTNDFANIKLVGGGTGASTYIKIGTGDFNEETAKFYVDGTGKFSLGDKLRFEPQNPLGPLLVVNGVINATDGVFQNTVTIGTSTNAGRLRVGASARHFMIEGTNANTTTAIYTDGAEYQTSGIWLDASGRFSIGNKFIWNGTNLSITGAINATSGNFTNTVTIGTAETNGSLKVGTGAQHFKIDGTPTNTTTAIYTASASFGESGVWLDASGRFSLGSKFNWDGSALSVTGAINATSGTFLNTVNIGSHATNTLKLTGTSSAATTAISSGTSTYKTGGIWMDASGRFSLGTDKLWFDGTDLTVAGNIVGGSFSVDSNNYWNTAGHIGEFRVGDSTNSLYWNGTSLSLTGSITANSGSIAGWLIGTDEIYKGTGTSKIALNAGSTPKIYIGNGTHANTNTGFYVDSSGKFSLSNQLIFEPAGNIDGDFSQLTIAGKISGAVDPQALVQLNKLLAPINKITVLTSTTAKVEIDSSHTHKFAIGESLVIEGIESPANELNRIYTIIAVEDNTKFTVETSISFTLSVGFEYVDLSGLAIANLRELTLGVHPAQSGYHTAGTGIRLDKYNWWFTNNQFRVGTSDSYVKWNGTSLDVSGVINAKSGNFEGALTVNSGDMKIGANVVSGKHGLRIDANNYWYSNGEFKVGGTNGITYTPGIDGPDIILGSDVKVLGDISGASGAFTGDLVGGTIIGSTIRGSDVFANSAQIGGNAYGWIAGAGGLFSGTKESTSYLQSGFYSNEIVDIVQETEVGSSNIKRNLFIKTSKITSAELEPDGFTIKYISDNSFYKGEGVIVTGITESDYNSDYNEETLNPLDQKIDTIEYASSGEFYVRKNRTGITPTFINSTTGVVTSQTSILGAMTGNSRSPYISFANDIKNIEIGYELWIVSQEDFGPEFSYPPTSWNNKQFEYVGVVSEIVNSKLVKLRSTAPRIINNENFAITYVNSTITTQFFSGLPESGRKISIETPGTSDYAVAGIFAIPDTSDDKIIRTKSIPPVFATGTSVQKEFSGSPCFLSFSTGSNDNVELNIKRVSALKEPNSVDPDSPFYNVKIYIDIEDKDQLSVGDNILLSNISVGYDLFYSLNSNYFPIINITEETINTKQYAVLEIYADGYLSFANNPSPIPFTSYDVSSYEVLNNTVTLTLYPTQLNQKNINSLQYNSGPKTYTFVMESDHGIKQNDRVLLSRNNLTYIVSSVNGNTVVIPSSAAITGITSGDKLSLLSHRFESGQVITVPSFDDRGYIDNEWTGKYVISDVPESNKISYQKVLPNSIDQVVPEDFNVIAFSYPLVQIYNNTKNYALWVGASSPDEAPFSIDTYGQNLKVKNLEVTGEVKGFYSDIIELDDFSGSFDGRNNAFKARYNQKELVLDNPLRLVISLNGVVQSAFIQNREYVWQSGLMGFKGYTVDNGKIKFAESPPHGSTINARVFPGPQLNKKTRIYPFKAVDVALG
jgi:hypothetical protein